MTLPRLYENVTLRSYTEIRYVDGRPEGYGSGSPFAMGLNTLVTRNFSDYVQTFRAVGDWKEHDMEDYSKGRVPDNSMMLQLAMRAALDKMKNLKAFAWELNTKPLQTIYQSLMARPSITSLTLRFQTKRIPRPTTLVPPFPSLITLVLYDIDPLCYPDDISLVLLHAKKLENLKLHFSPRMRESGEESVNILNYFGRCIAAKYKLPVKRLAIYNLYTRSSGDGFEDATDPARLEEMSIFNSMGSSDPMTVFLDDTWRVKHQHACPHNLKMIRGDSLDKEMAHMMAQFRGLDRLYFVERHKGSKASSVAATPASPTLDPPSQNGTKPNDTPFTEFKCKGLAAEYLAVIQSNHRTMRHLLLPDHWQLSDNAIFKLCQSCPDLEQIGFASAVPPLESLAQILGLVPKVWALRLLIRPGSDLAEKLDSMDLDLHSFAMAHEFWKPEYKNLKYVGFGSRLIFKLGAVTYPALKAKNGTILSGQDNNPRMRPYRQITRLTEDDVKHIEIWGLDTAEFDPKFP
jgi:hypothetical protein